MNDQFPLTTSLDPLDDSRPLEVRADEYADLALFLAEEEWPEDEVRPPDKWHNFLPSYLPLAEVQDRELDRLGIYPEASPVRRYPTYSVRASMNGLRIKLGSGAECYMQWRHLWKNAKYAEMLPFLRQTGVTVHLIPASVKRILVRSSTFPMLFVHNATQGIRDRYFEFQLVFDTRTRWLVETSIPAEFFDGNDRTEEVY